MTDDDETPTEERARRVTLAESPSAMVRRAQALINFSDRCKLDGDLSRLLGKVLEGHRGPQLARALGVSPQEVDELERRFETQVDRSVYEAAVDVLSAARDSSIRPPPSDDPSDAEGP